MSTSKRTTKPRETFHHGDLNAALRKAALAFIRRRGQEGFSLREVAREVGVSPSATYRHFADRAALLTAVAADGFTKLGMQLEKASASVDESNRGKAERARFRAMIATYVRFATAHPEEFRVMFGPYGIGGSYDAVLRLREPGRPRAVEQLRARIDGLMSTGEIPPGDRDQAAIFVWATGHGLAWLLLDGALNSMRITEETEDAIVDAITHRVLLGLGAH